MLGFVAFSVLLYLVSAFNAERDVDYYLIKRGNEEHFFEWVTKAEILSVFDSTLPTIFYIHGWEDDPNSKSFHFLKK